jgi:hypothetical protein
VLHAIRWLSSPWEEISSETIVKCFRLAGFCNNGEQDLETDDDSGLNQVICSLPLNLQDLASVNDVESCDADIIIHEEIACTPDVFWKKFSKKWTKNKKAKIVTIVMWKATVI